MKIPFSPPDIRQEDIDAVCEVLKSGWITTGPKTAEFEKQLKERLKADAIVCMNSQTAAAEMGLRLLGIGPGDEVIVPAYTYTASASVIDHCGADIVMVDCKPDSFEMDYDQLETKITEKTKAIIPVDLGGVPCDYGRIYEIVEKKKDLYTPGNDLQRQIGRITIHADGAHALGAKQNGIPAGALADLTAFSFHAVKNLTTAEGGALALHLPEPVDNEALAKELHTLILHGQSKSALEKTKKGSWEYDVLCCGFKCNMTDMMAALGLSQLGRYDAILERRKQIVKAYDKAFDAMGLKHLNHFDPGAKSSYHLYLLQLPFHDPDKRQAFINAMEEQGISVNVHYKPLPLLSAYKDKGFDIKDYPNAYAHYVDVVSLPLHTLLSDANVSYIIEGVQKAMDAIRA